MLKPALQGVDRGRAKLKLRVVDVNALPSRDSIAFVSQRASPATYAWVKVDGVQNYESRLADLLICKLPICMVFHPLVFEYEIIDALYCNDIFVIIQRYSAM